jgi:hypothetical protein
MAERNFRDGWNEIPSNSEKYSNFINSQDLIYVYMVAAFVDVIIFILIVVQQSPVSPSPVTIAQNKFSLYETRATVRLLKAIIRLDRMKKPDKPQIA